LGFSRHLIKLLFVIALVSHCSETFSQKVNIVTIAENGWANNSVNTVIFRKNALITHQNTQYVAYYDSEQYVVLAKRTTGHQNWEIQRTPYLGDATDAHKSISIVVDGAGFLHVAWGQHNNRLNYAKSNEAGSLNLGIKQAMTSLKEDKVSYPEFYKLKNGDLLFLYRDGGSGNGDLVINRYNIKTRNWIRVQNKLIDGQGKHNAYWQTAIDKEGTLHISWVWRDNPDVASNHDLCYAKSADGGATWQKSTGEEYSLPIHIESAEYVCKIPKNSELINQTSMYADKKGHVIIASYWRDQQDSIPQYHLAYNINKRWVIDKLTFRQTPFSLNGQGTKKIPISRPQIIAGKMEIQLH